MGLDISAYTRLTDAPEAETMDEDARWHTGVQEFAANPYFPGREAPIERGKFYRAADKFGFRAGSYSGYSRWRAGLARLAGYVADHGEAWDVPASGPFVELVNFSDCEGTLGSTVCAKLKEDFAAFAERALTHEDDYWREKYGEWFKAVTMAADGGAIAFH